MRTQAGATGERMNVRRINACDEAALRVAHYLSGATTAVAGAPFAAGAGAVAGWPEISAAAASPLGQEALKAGLKSAVALPPGRWSAVRLCPGPPFSTR